MNGRSARDEKVRAGRQRSLPEVMDVALDDLKRLPTREELPYDDGVPMDSELHVRQAYEFLIKPLRVHLEHQGIQAFVGGNSFVYYQPPAKNVGPDIYVVNGGKQGDQASWIAWLEGGLLPTLIIELLSPSTEKEDRGRKFVLYRDTFKTQDYFLYDVGKQRLEGFHLRGADYLPVLKRPDGRIPCQSLPLSLGVHDGWLRWFDADGGLVPTDEERAVKARAHMEAERQRAEAERQRAEVERRRAEVERRRADAAQAELQKLREELRRRDEGDSASR